MLDANRNFFRESDRTGRLWSEEDARDPRPPLTPAVQVTYFWSGGGNNDRSPHQSTLRFHFAPDGTLLQLDRSDRPAEARSRLFRFCC